MVNCYGRALLVEELSAIICCFGCFLWLAHHQTSCMLQIHDALGSLVLPAHNVNKDGLQVEQCNSVMYVLLFLHVVLDF